MAEGTSDTSQASGLVTAIGLQIKTAGGMKYRRVGKSGLTVSEMGVGCFSFGTIGLIPALSDWRDRKAPFLVTKERPRSPSAEAYRALRTSIKFMALERPVKILQVTSPGATEGKTTTAANLAYAMGESGQRVVLVDCDLRRPRVHEFFGLPNDRGLRRSCWMRPRSKRPSIGFRGTRACWYCRPVTSPPTPPNCSRAIGPRGSSATLPIPPTSSSSTVLRSCPSLTPWCWPLGSTASCWWRPTGSPLLGA